MSTADRLRAAASNNAERDLLLYARTRERAFVWRVYKAHRRAGMAIPDRVLTIFDEWASEPASRRSAKKIRAAEHSLDIVQDTHIRQHELGQTSGKADEATAVQFGTTVGAVRTKKSRWNAGAEPRASAAVDQSDEASLQTVWPGVVTQNGELP